jgi:hypothetical protein
LGFGALGAGPQEAALKAAGCQVIRAEKRSGTTTEGREALRTVLEFLHAGDVLTVTRIDGLARSIADLQNIVRTVRARGAVLKACTRPRPPPQPRVHRIPQASRHRLSGPHRYQAHVVLPRTARNRPDLNGNIGLSQVASKQRSVLRGRDAGQTDARGLAELLTQGGA